MEYFILGVCCLIMGFAIGYWFGYKAGEEHTAIQLLSTMFSSLSKPKQFDAKLVDKDK